MYARSISRAPVFRIYLGHRYHVPEAIHSSAKVMYSSWTGRVSGRCNGAVDVVPRNTPCFQHRKKSNVSAIQGSSSMQGFPRPEETVEDVKPKIASSHMRRNSTALPKVFKRTFRGFDVYSTSSDVKFSERPLVLMIPWLNAKMEHVDKYIKLYTESGIDVLHVQVNPLSIFRPLRTKKVVRRLLDMLQEEEGPLVHKPLIIHGFSIGAFVWGQLLVEMAETSNGSFGDIHDDAGPSRMTAAEVPCESYPVNPTSMKTKSSSPGDGTPAVSIPTAGSTTRDVQSRIVGVVMDSPTPVETLLDGISISMSGRPGIRYPIKLLLATYLKLFPRSVASHYFQSGKAVEDNAERHPTLVLYSSADKVSPAWKVEQVVERWRRQGIPFRARKWTDSPHVGHFRVYPEQYKEELLLFIDDCRVNSLRSML